MGSTSLNDQRTCVGQVGSDLTPTTHVEIPGGTIVNAKVTESMVHNAMVKMPKGEQNKPGTSTISPCARYARHAKIHPQARLGKTCGQACR